MTSPAPDSTTRIALVKGAQGIALALVLMVLACTVLVGGSYVVAGTHTGESARAAGELAGLLLLPVLGGSFFAGLAWPWPQRRRLAAILTFGVLSVSLAVPALLFAARQSRRPPEVTDAERATPTPELVDGRPCLVQRATGFEMPEPPGLAFVADDPLVAQMLEAHPEQAASMALWRYANADGTAMVLVALALERPQDTGAFMRGMVDGAAAQFPESLGPIERESRGPLDEILRARPEGGTSGMTMRVFAYAHGEDTVFATVTVAGQDLAALEPIATAARGRE
jgi:hypothetical protein